MSSIPSARVCLHIALGLSTIEEKDAYIREALSLMTREPPVRRAPPVHSVIDDKTKRYVHAMAEHTDMTMAEIAEKLHIPNQGRVSEILTGKR